MKNTPHGPHHGDPNLKRRSLHQQSQFCSPSMIQFFRYRDALRQRRGAIQKGSPGRKRRFEAGRGWFSKEAQQGWTTRESYGMDYLPLWNYIIIIVRSYYQDIFCFFLEYIYIYNIDTVITLLWNIVFWMLQWGRGWLNDHETPLSEKQNKSHFTAWMSRWKLINGKCINGL